MASPKAQLAAHLNILTEDTLTAEEAIEELSQFMGGKRLSKPTIYRWAMKGLHGGRVRLDYVKIGSSIITSRQALTRFIEAKLIAEMDPANGRPSDLKPKRKPGRPPSPKPKRKPGRPRKSA